MSKKIFDEFKELRATSGVGSALYAKNITGYYSLFMPLENVPNPKGMPDSIDVDVTTSNAITKVEGRESANDMECEYFLHRDNLRRLEEWSDKGVCDFLIVYPDYTGYKFSATIAYTPGEATGGDTIKGSFKLTPTKLDGHVDNCYDLIQPTAKFTNGIASTVEITEDNGTYELLVETDPADATVTVKSENETIATAELVGNKLTITRVKDGSCIINLNVTKEDYADWDTTIHVACK